jgi:hypothetical protein
MGNCNSSNVGMVWRFDGLNFCEIGEKKPFDLAEWFYIF